LHQKKISLQALTPAKETNKLMVIQFSCACKHHGLQETILIIVFGDINYKEKSTLPLIKCVTDTEKSMLVGNIIIKFQVAVPFQYSQTGANITLFLLQHIQEPTTSTSSMD
jgi:hypothetical protein